MSGEAARAFRVMVDSNARYQDEEERYQHGEYATRDEAEAVCRAIVERSLRELLKPGMGARALFEMYCQFGDDPFVAPGQADDFSAWDYARQQSKILTAVPDSLGGSSKRDDEHHSP